MKKYLLLGVLCVVFAETATASDTNYSSLISTGGYCYADSSVTDHNCSPGVANNLASGEWSVPFSQKGGTVDVIGVSFASSIYNGESQYSRAKDQSTIQSAYEKGTQNGDHCYCKMNTPDESEWMYYGVISKSGVSCAGRCAINTVNSAAYSAMFSRIISSGGLIPGGGSFDYLLSMPGKGQYCYIQTTGKLLNNGCPLDAASSITELGEWASVLGNGKNDTTVTGIAVLADLKLEDTTIGAVPNASMQSLLDAAYAQGSSSGRQCFCKAHTPGESSWVLAAISDKYALTDGCPSYCSGTVVGEFSGGGKGPADAAFVSMVDTMRTVNAGDRVIPTSMTYVVDGLSHKLDVLDNLGGTKMLMYSTNSVYQIGAPRDIVRSLGTVTNGLYTDTTSNGAVERGVIKTAIDGKQNASVINDGTEDYVVVYTNTPGQLDEKPVYGVNTNFSDALVTAGTVNSAIVDAVNSELIQVDENGTAAPGTGTLWKLNAAADLTLLESVLALHSVPSGFYLEGPLCYRRPDGNNYAQGNYTEDCSPKPGLAKVAESNGYDVYVAVLCSDIESSGRVPDATTQAQLNTQYNNWTPGTSQYGANSYLRVYSVNGGLTPGTPWVKSYVGNNEFDCETDGFAAIASTIVDIDTEGGDFDFMLGDYLQQ